MHASDAMPAVVVLIGLGGMVTGIPALRALADDEVTAGNLLALVVLPVGGLVSLLHLNRLNIGLSVREVYGIPVLVGTMLLAVLHLCHSRHRPSQCVGVCWLGFVAALVLLWVAQAACVIFVASTDSAANALACRGVESKLLSFI